MKMCPGIEYRRVEEKLRNRILPGHPPPRGRASKLPIPSQHWFSLLYFLFSCLRNNDHITHIYTYYKASLGNYFDRILFVYVALQTHTCAAVSSLVRCFAATFPSSSSSSTSIHPSIHPSCDLPSSGSGLFVSE